MSTETLIFTRTEQMKTTQVAVLTVTNIMAEATRSIMERLEYALTEWVNETQEGQAEWKASCEDFNIGDLINARTPVMDKFLLAQGLKIEGIETMSTNNASDYDTVLVDRSNVINSA